MKALLVLLTLISNFALASGPNNIHGIGNRLETITCRGAYVYKLKDQEKIYEDIERYCSSLPTEELGYSCLGNVFKANGKAEPSATFLAQANQGVKTFQMNIFEGSKSVFSSTRIGGHADGERGISLYFEVQENHEDKYTIETGELINDSTDYLAVPVKRRLIADLVYVFLDGCSLKWER